MAKTANPVENPNFLGALSYLLFFVSGIILFLGRPKDSYVHFHSLQSVIWSVGAVVLWAFISLLLNLLGPLTFGLFPFLLGPIRVLYGAAFILSWLYLMFKAYIGERYQLPVVGELADKYA